MKSLKNISFYPIFSEPISVYDNVHPEYYSATNSDYTDQYSNTVYNGVTLSLVV
jgi:hypothetical protein